MDGGAELFRVDFGKALPLFVLGGVTLLPRTVAPFHVFESRYVQMVSRALDSDGVIVMAVRGDGDGVKPAVCVGRVVQHSLMGDGRFNVLLQGVCRARVVEEVAADGETMYPRGVLEPVADVETELEMVRRELLGLFESESMRDLCAAESVAGALSSEEAPTKTLLELISMSVLTDEGVKYRLLEEGDVGVRAGVLLGELGRLREILVRAKGQREMQVGMPRGVWLN